MSHRPLPFDTNDKVFEKRSVRFIVVVCDFHVSGEKINLFEF